MIQRWRRLFFRWGIPLILMAIFLAFCFSLNRDVKRVPLVSRRGQTFEAVKNG